MNEGRWSCEKNMTQDSHQGRRGRAKLTEQHSEQKSWELEGDTIHSK